MKKKVLSLLFTVTLLISLLTSCSSNKKTSDASSQEKEETQTVMPTVSEEPKPSKETEITLEPTITLTPEEPVKPESKEYPIEAIETAGAIDETTYSNSNIGFTMSVPKSWLVFGTDETYNYVAESLGYPEDKIATLKEEVRAKGVTYLFYGNDTQLSKDGDTDRITAEAINTELFQGLGIEEIVTTLSKASEEQYISKGGTCEISDPIKTTIGDQDVYQVPTTVSYEVPTGDTTSKQELSLVSIIFQRNNTVVYMILSTDLESSEELVQSMLETLSFQ